MPHEQADPHDLDLLPAAVPGADDQRDLPAVLEGRRARQRPAQPPRSSRRRTPASAARSWSAATRSPRACASDDQYEFQRTYPKPLSVRPVTGYFSFYSARPASSRPRTTCSPATTPLLFVTKLVDLLSNKPRKGGNVQLTLDPDAQAGGVRRPARRSARRAGRRWWRSSRAPARSWRWCRCRPTTPTSSPPTTSSSVTDTLRPAQGRPDRAAAQPGDPDPAAARLDVQARHRGGGDREGPLHRRRQRARRRDLPAAADHGPDRPDRQRGPQLRRERRQDPVHPGDGAVLQHHLRPARGEVGAEDMLETAEEFGFNQPLPRRPRPAGRLGLPRRRRRRPARPDRHRPVRGPGHPAADGDGRRRDRQRGRRDEALPRRRAAVRRPRRAREDRPEELSQAVSPDDRQRGHRADGLDRRRRAPPSPAAIPGISRRRQDRHRPERRATTARRTPGSSRSPRPTTPRSPSP